jgi:hypothetical protein
MIHPVVHRSGRLPNSEPRYTEVSMHEQRLRSEVIVRLMMRHGLSIEEADIAWEQYRLQLQALRVRQEGSREGLGNN